MNDLMLFMIIQSSLMAILILLVVKSLKLVGDYYYLVSTLSKNDNHPRMTYLPKFHIEKTNSSSKKGIEEHLEKSTSKNLLLFVSPGCSACTDLIKNISKTGKLFNKTTITIISSEKNSDDNIFYKKTVNQLNYEYLYSEDIIKNRIINRFPYYIALDGNEVVSDGVASNPKTFETVANKLGEGVVK